MWLMLQAEKPADFVLATGKTISVRTMVEEAFRYNELRSYLGMREGTNK
jgi:GDPmannose 4,6-dehydratase